jgi:hypothetical protein
MNITLSVAKRPDVLRVSIEDGKYTVVVDPDHKAFVLRYGEDWMRNIVGDNLVLGLAREVQDLRDQLSFQKAAVEESLMIIAGGVDRIRSAIFPEQQEKHGYVWVVSQINNTPSGSQVVEYYSRRALGDITWDENDENAVQFFRLETAQSFVDEYKDTGGPTGILSITAKRVENE